MTNQNTAADLKLANLLAVAVLVALAAVLAFQFGAPISGITSFTRSEPGKQGLLNILRDPSSVEFRDTFVSRSGYWCGEFNSANGMGGMSGFERFYTGERKGEAFAVTADSEARVAGMLGKTAATARTEFDADWEAHCERRG